MKSGVLRVISFFVGSFNLYLLVAGAYSGGAVAVFMIVSLVSMAFMAYGIGGNVTLTRMPLLGLFAKPMGKGALKGLLQTERV